MCARPTDQPGGSAAPYSPYNPCTPLTTPNPPCTTLPPTPIPLLVHPLTGARGLLTILEAALRPYNFELPSHAVRSLKVNAQMIREPQAQLERLLERLELGSKE